MTDKPIIFSAPMVRALLDGTKTQTRRVLKPTAYAFEPPKYRAGDRLWVGEAWRVGAWAYELSTGGPRCWCAKVAVDYVADGFARREWIKGDNTDQMLRIADQSRKDAEKDGRFGPDEIGGFSWPIGETPCRYRHPRYMPRWASRLTLTVTDVRVQRVQDISTADAKAEGAQCETCAAMSQSHCNAMGCFACIASFRTLWDSIHGPDAWDRNAWVAAYTFTVAHQNIDEVAA